MDRLFRSFREAGRSLVRRPWFSIVALLTLALGIGATVAIFTVLDAVVLKPLPYSESERLVRIENRVPGIDPDERWNLSPAGFLHYRDASRSLADLGVYRTARQNLTAEGPAERVQVAQVSEGLFRTLRAKPAYGRLLTPDDDRPGNEEPGFVLPGPAVPVAVLGHEFWLRRYGGDPDIIGRTIMLDGTSVPVVGVLEEGMNAPNPGVSVDVWMPLGLNPASSPTSWHPLQAVGRLRDGVSVTAAQAELQELTARFDELFPSAYSAAFMAESGFTPDVTPLRDFVVGDLARTLWVLLAAVGLVLLIAAANTANLFLVRTEGRRRELGIRAAMGASRAQLARQSLSEGVVIGLMAGAVGLVLGIVGARVLVAAAPEDLPRLDEVAVGPTVAVFALAVALLVGLVVGCFPLLRFGRELETGFLREGSRGADAGSGPQVVRSILVVGQIAMALVLLAGAGLLLQSFHRLRSVDPGFDPRGILTVQIPLPAAGYQTYESVRAFHEELSHRIRALPGVEAVGATSSLPLAGGSGCTSVFLYDRPPAADDQAPCVPHAQITPGYLQTLGVGVAGRIPDWDDDRRLTGAVVVSRGLAARLWPGEDPIGKRLRPNGWGEPFYDVVGVANEVRATGLDEPATDLVYYPVELLPGTEHGWRPPRTMTLLVRTGSSEPEALTAMIRHAVADVDAQVPITTTQTMQEVIASSTARTLFATLLLGTAAGMALLLTFVGLYGTIAYVAGQRTREIGLRIALGARMEQAAGLVVRQALGLAVAGVVIGLAGALATMRVLHAFLFEITPGDPITLGAVALLIVGVGLAAAYLPARRAARVDPMVALRTE